MASKLRRARKIKWSKRLKTHGFMIRMLTKNWRNVLKRRREKGRHQLTPQKSK